MEVWPAALANPMDPLHPAQSPDNQRRVRTVKPSAKARGEIVSLNDNGHPSKGASEPSAARFGYIDQFHTKAPENSAVLSLHSNPPHWNP
jgi:hypothetical protein